MAGDIRKTKTFLYISNAVIALMCVISMAGYFIMPAGRVSLSVRLDRSTLTVLRDSMSKKRNGSTTAHSARIPNVVLSNGDIGTEIEETIQSSIAKLSEEMGPEMVIDALMEELGERTVTLSAGAGISTPRLLSSIGATDERALEMLLRDNVDNIVDDTLLQLENIKPLLVNTAERLLKTASSLAIQTSFEAVKDIIAERSGANAEAEFDDFVERVGLDEGSIGEKVSSVIESMSTDGMTADQIAEEAETIYKDLYERAKNDPKYGADVLDKYEYDPEGFREGLKEWIDNSGLQGEDGTINIDLIIDRLFAEGLLDMLPDDAVEYTASTTSSARLSASSVSAASSEVASGRTDVRNELKASLNRYVDKLLESGSLKDSARPVRITLIVLAALTLVHIIAWLYLLVKILVKLFKPNPGVTLWVPVAFGWSILGLLTFIPVKLALGTPGSLICRIFPALASWPAINVWFRFLTGGVIAAVCGIVLFIFGFVYRHYRHKLRDLLKASDEEGGR